MNKITLLHMPFHLDWFGWIPKDLVILQGYNYQHMYTLTRDTLISIIIILFILLTNNIGGLAILGLPLMMLSSQRVKVQVLKMITTG